VGVPGCRAATATVGFQRFPGKALRYTGEDTFTVATADECERRCVSDQSCVAFTYFRNSKQCRPMRAPTELSDNRDADSGFRLSSREPAHEPPPEQTSGQSGFVQFPSDEDYIFDILKKNPRISEAWKWIVPKGYAKLWIYNLSSATSAPVERILMSGKKFILGEACWPHNCGGNHVIFLIAADASEAYGLLSSESLTVSEEYFGSPNKEKVDVLRKRMKGNLHEFDKYYGQYNG
jgi:PAN domain/Inhibitor of vertebrate lysozyme (Ivy)